RKLLHCSRCAAIRFGSLMEQDQASKYLDQTLQNKRVYKRQQQEKQKHQLLPKSNLSLTMKCERRREQCHPLIVLFLDRSSLKQRAFWNRRWKPYNVRRAAR